ncbi:MAG: aspartate aminotransferase family protein [Phycisphaerales bacterium]|nr:aspartate aminotransferase family protein [Phycisphaerales bacterium]
MTTRSAELYRRACAVLPGGVSRNAVFRAPHPVYAERGSGCRVTDIDGVERLDFAGNMASLIHGHAFGPVVAAVTEQLRRGTAWNLGTRVEIEFAELLTGRAPGFERIRFVNSGTEAVLCALKVARAFTGRPKIAKVEGAYHGVYDYAEVSQTASPADWGPADHPASVPVCAGTPAGVLGDVVVIPFNDTERALALLEAEADRLACVLIDPLPHRVGMMPAADAFIAAIHAWARRRGALLVFDEVITFRCGYGGAQERYAVRPDLTALGKIIGGGFPVGALAGRADVMDVLNPLRTPLLFPHSGTFSANPVTMTAGLTAMRHFDRDAVARLNALGERARERIRAAIRDAQVPLSVTGAGSLFRIHPMPSAPEDYRRAYHSPARAALKRRIVDFALDHGVILIESCSGALSTPMTGGDIDQLTAVLAEAFRASREHALAIGA